MGRSPGRRLSSLDAGESNSCSKTEEARSERSQYTAECCARAFIFNRIRKTFSVSTQSRTGMLTFQLRLIKRVRLTSEMRIAHASN